MIKRLVKEGLMIVKSKEIIHENVNNSFKNTIFYNHKQFLKESVELLHSNDIGGFYKNLYESAELLDALMDICVLSFSSENVKVGGSVATFSLPAGWSCPYAHSCAKYVERDRNIDPEKVGTFKISKKTGEKVPYKGDVVVTKGKDAEFDCYAANMEMQYDALRANRWHNYDLLNEAGDSQSQADLIIRSLKYFFDEDGVKDTVRIHESGDFYDGDYLKAWMIVARKMPQTHFYAYTKSVPLIKKYKKEIDAIPNLAITLSSGGKRDKDLPDVDIKESKVFNTPEEALEAGIIIDLDDTLARVKGGKEANFGLLVHGTQEKGGMMQNKIRNETFMAYWKYRKEINRFFNKPEDYIWNTKEAQEAVDLIIDIIKNPKKYTKSFSKSDLQFKGKLMRYIIKYNNYNFSPDLINVIPEKYR
jgi:hypothetical protein